MKFFSEKIRGLSNKEIQKRAGNRYYQCVSPPTILISCSYSTAAFTAASNAAVSQVVNKPATPSMAIADITAALEAAVKAAVEYEQDIKVIGGETH